MQQLTNPGSACPANHLGPSLLSVWSAWSFLLAYSINSAIYTGTKFSPSYWLIWCESTKWPEVGNATFTLRCWNCWNILTPEFSFLAEFLHLSALGQLPTALYQLPWCLCFSVNAKELEKSLLIPQRARVFLPASLTTTQNGCYHLMPHPKFSSIRMSLLPRTWPQDTHW